MDSLKERWRLLEPHIEVFGPPDDQPRPAVILFHGCGGLREHIHRYAALAAAIGCRAFVVDSFAPRHWSRTFVLMTVCSGVIFRGDERSGDVLAALWGVRQRRDVDAHQICLAGWSHGAWSIMDLMTYELTSEGDAYLTDPSPEAMAGVQSVFLAYPYGGFPARSRYRSWRWSPDVFGVIAERDHITSVHDAERIYDAARSAGCEIELWKVAASHAFDEPGAEEMFTPMRYDADLAAIAHAKYQMFLKRTLNLGPESLGQDAEPAPAPRSRQA